MTWFAWRQFRFQALVVLGLLVGVAVFFALTGPHQWELYDSLKTCKAHGDCQAITHSILNEYNKYLPFVQGLSLLLPALLGIFWGAPLIARELETGTYRLAWSQGVTRSRWVLTKLAVVGGASMLAAGLLSWMLTWWASPIDTLNESRFGSLVFDTSYIAPIGYAAFAFALGVTLGVLVRRTLPAMATTIVAFAAVRILFAHFVRPRLLSPLKQVISLRRVGNIGFERTPDGVHFVVGDSNRPNSLTFGTSVVGNHGGEVTPLWLKHHCHSLLQLGGPVPGKGGKVTTGIRPAAFTDCINKITSSFHEVLTYQPAGRFWTFQWLELTIYVVVALLLSALTYWWVTRRIT